MSLVDDMRELWMEMEQDPAIEEELRTKAYRLFKRMEENCIIIEGRPEEAEVSHG